MLVLVVNSNTSNVLQLLRFKTIKDENQESKVSSPQRLFPKKHLNFDFGLQNSPKRKSSLEEMFGHLYY